MSTQQGCFGKLAIAGDFLRTGPTGRITTAFESWLFDVTGQGGRFETDGEPVQFLFAVPEAEDVLLGTLMGSADALGRRFPFAVYHRMPIEECVSAKAFAMAQFWPQFEADRAWVRQLQSDPNRANDRFRQGPPAVSFFEAQSARMRGERALAASSSAEFQDRTFGRSSVQHWAEVSGMFQEAMGLATKPQTTGGIVCPAPDFVSVLFWLEWIRVSQPTRPIASAFWRRSSLLSCWGTQSVPFRQWQA